MTTDPEHSLNVRPHPDSGFFHDPQLAGEQRIRQYMKEPRSDFQDMVSRLAFKAKNDYPGILARRIRPDIREVHIKGNNGAALLNAD